MSSSHNADPAASGEHPDLRGESIRVAVVGSGPPARGGIPSFIELVTRPGFFDDDVVVTVVNTTRVETRTAGRFSLANVKSVVSDAFRTTRAARKVDVVHVHVAPGRPLPAARAVALCLAARLGRARVICHIHSARINGGQPDELHPGRIYRWLLRQLRFAHLILTVSEAGTETVRRLVPRGKVRTLNNAVDVASIPHARPSDPPVVLFVGTLSKRKGLHDLLRASIALRDRGQTDWRLMIVGGANEVGEAEASALRRQYQEAGFGDALRGSLDANGVRAALADASVFVLPSYAEGQPIALLEAMAAGLPAVATAVGANPDVVAHGKTGLIVAPGDVDALAEALGQLLDDPVLARSMGERARCHVMAHHDATVLSRSLRATYREQLREKR